jgi:antitoxin HigA-1
MGLSQVELAKRMRVPVQRVNTLINGKRDVTAETAILLSRVLKNSSEFWMNLQVAYDLYKAQSRLGHTARIHLTDALTPSTRPAKRGSLRASSESHEVG